MRFNMSSAFFALVQFLLNAMMSKSWKIVCFLPNFQRLRTEKKKKRSGEAKKELQNYVIFAHKGRDILSCQKWPCKRILNRVRMDGQTNGRVDEQMDGRTDGWTDRCMGGRTSVPTEPNAQSCSIWIKIILHHIRIHLKRKTLCRHLDHDKFFFLFFIFENHNAKKKKISDFSFWREMRANTLVYVFIIKVLKRAAPRTNARIHECILTSFYFLCSYLCIL